MTLDAHNWSFVGEVTIRGPKRKSGAKPMWYYYISRTGHVVRHRSDRPDEIIAVNSAFTANKRVDGKFTTGYLAVPTNKLPEKYVHRMVAKAFCANPDPLTHTQVDHIDADKTNNHWTNLEWVTQSENMRRMHARRRAEGKKWYGRAGDPKEQS